MPNFRGIKMYSPPSPPPPLGVVHKGCLDKGPHMKINVKFLRSDLIPELMTFIDHKEHHYLLLIYGKAKYEPKQKKVSPPPLPPLSP